MLVLFLSSKWIFCANYVSTKCSEAVAVMDPQIALLLLNMCGSFSKLVNLVRITPTALMFEAHQLSC